MIDPAALRPDVGAIFEGETWRRHTWEATVLYTDRVAE